MKKILFNFRFLLPAMALILVATSCKKKDDPAPQARLMVIHASPDAPGVDLLIDDNKKNSAALTYPNNTGYLNVDAGTRNIKVNAAGTTTTVINANLQFTANQNYSVYAINNVASISAIAVTDNLTAPASGNAHIRFFHLSPNAPAVNVGTLNGTTFTGVFNNRSFETQTTAAANQAFTPVPAGTYNFDVRLASGGTSVLTLNNITLQAGKIYTVFAKGLVGNATTPLGAEIIVHN